MLNIGMSMKIRRDTTWRNNVVFWLWGFLQLSCSMADHMTESLHRQLRELSYPEDSEMGIFFALAIPVDDPVSTKSISVAFFFEANYELVEQKSVEETARKESAKNVQYLTRKNLYSMLQSKFEALGLPGRSCILRSICETSQWSLHPHNGLVGDLLRILFTPSSSMAENLSDEYIEAESADQCATTYPFCPVSIYDYITSTIV